MELLSESEISALYDHTKNIHINFDTLTTNSNKKAWWKCAQGHTWEETIANTAKTTIKCCYCSHRKLLQGFNDFATKNPELLKEWDNTKNETSPSDIKFNQNIDIWWKCENGHSWQATAAYRNKGYGKCAQCTSLGENFPNLLKEWDYDKNTIDPFHVKYGSVEHAHWIGQNCGHSWTASIRNRTRDNQNCPYCAGQKILQGFNDLETLNPELAKYWSDENVKTVHETGNNGKTPVIWKAECGHSWTKTINHMKNLKNIQCPTCNSIQYTHTNIAQQFHTTKNKNVNILDISAGSHKIVWWVAECSHEWQQSVYNRIHNSIECPICRNQQIIVGFNDFATVNKNMMHEWDYEKNSIDPSTVTSGSQKKAWWKCAKNHSWEAIISDRNRGSGCPDCNTAKQFSKAEKEIVELLKPYVSIIENSRTILQNKTELDIYIPEKKIAIEFNGLYWHTENSGKDKNYHYHKWQNCFEQGIQLITVWEDDWNNNKELVKNMLLHKIGESHNKRIFARKTIIQNISTQQSREFMNSYHIQGSVDSSIRLGLLYNDKIVAVMLFKKRNKDDIELVRYATSDIVVGGFTKLLKHFEKQYEYKRIISFADHSVSDGGLYVNNGFVVDSYIAPDYKYVVKNKREHKFNYRLKRFKNDSSLLWVEGSTERELAIMNNLYRIWDCGKTKYVKILDKE